MLAAAGGCPEPFDCRLSLRCQVDFDDATDTHGAWDRPAAARIVSAQATGVNMPTVPFVLQAVDQSGRRFQQKAGRSTGTLRRRSVRRVTDDAEAAELEPSEELLAARSLETGLVEEDETYIYTPDELLDADVAADYVWLQKGTGRKVYLVKKEQGPASQG